LRNYEFCASTEFVIAQIASRLLIPVTLNE